MVLYDRETPRKTAANEHKGHGWPAPVEWEGEGGPEIRARAVCIGLARSFSPEDLQPPRVYGPYLTYVQNAGTVRRMPRFEMRLSQEEADRIDRARGETPRATWIKRLLERELRGAAPPVVEHTFTRPVLESADTGQDWSPPAGPCPECNGVNGSHELECARRPGFE